MFWNIYVVNHFHYQPVQFDPAGFLARLHMRYLINAIAIQAARDKLTGLQVLLQAEISSSNCLSQSFGSCVGKFGGVDVVGVVCVHGSKPGGNPLLLPGLDCPPVFGVGPGTGIGIPAGPGNVPANPNGSTLYNGFPPT